MRPQDLLGRRFALAIRRFGPPGAFLEVDPENDRPDAPVILLPGAEIPAGAKERDEIEVFVYLDSAGRPIATTRPAHLCLGEVRFLTVTACTNIGAFVDWGLPKELLVPFAEQTVDELRVGDRHPIGLYVDKAERMAGTMRIREMLGLTKIELERDAWVNGESLRNDPEVGLFVIVERTRIGLVPASEPHRLSRGEAARFRVTSVLPDGKIELSLRGHAHQELDADAKRVLDVLARPGAPRLGDHSSPEEIRAVFGLSKKAFKRAVGRLLRERTVHLDNDGFLVALRR